ncbi:hypothetical protein [Clavibacter zhangzhiyongii]|uniref:hypothetical protein n=1 Tax=Clavibacter zhangzhiyongii TaxID=2768071 RepID=UPI0039E0B694
MTAASCRAAALASVLHAPVGSSTVSDSQGVPLVSPPVNRPPANESGRYTRLARPSAPRAGNQ